MSRTGFRFRLLMVLFALWFLPPSRSVIRVSSDAPHVYPRSIPLLRGQPDHSLLLKKVCAPKSIRLQKVTGRVQFNLISGARGAYHFLCHHGPDAPARHPFQPVFPPGKNGPDQAPARGTRSQTCPHTGSGPVPITHLAPGGSHHGSSHLSAAVLARRPADRAHGDPDGLQ